MLQTLAANSNYLKEVREQYENYPYPPRDPNVEKQSFFCVRSCSLDALNYYHYAGKRNFTKGFRALVAGGGTGDATIALAEQFRGLDAEIVHLDLSINSMQIAKARATVRGLDNITWIHGSILDAEKLFNAPFDFIESVGVLHHLENPAAGLAALTAVLKDDGVMNIMLYASYGRESIYQIQRLMRIINKDEPDMQRKVDNCKTVLTHASQSNAFICAQDIFNDAANFGDVGIYDLFLHSHDVAYSVPEIYQFLAGSGLQPAHFFFETQPMGNDLYKIEAYLEGSNLSDASKRLSVEESQTAAELMNGKIIKHNFYASKHKPALPSPDDTDNVPFLYMIVNKHMYHDLYQIAANAKTGDVFSCKIYVHEVKFVNTPNLSRICKAMDGDKSLDAIFKEVRMSYSATEKKPTMEELKTEFKAFFAAFNKQDLMFLRHKSLPRMATMEDILTRMKTV